MTFRQIFGTCIHAFGTPRQVFSDNGSKFVDDEFQEVGGGNNNNNNNNNNNRDNTTIMDSVSVTNMFLKICEYAKCDVEVALAWALVPKIL